MNKVYIVLVNYNNYPDTIECITSILKSDYSNYQIIVIDNSSDDSSIGKTYEAVNSNNNLYSCKKISEGDFFNKPYSEKIILVKAQNRGFAAANNIALKYILNTDSAASFVWILNNDTIVEFDALSNMVKYYHNDNTDKKIIAAKLRYYHKPNTIQAIVGHYNRWLGKHTHIGEGEIDNGQYDDYIANDMDYVVGASIFVSVNFIKKVGLMCEDYFLYFEELEWMQLAKKQNFTIGLVPNAIVYHKEGASIAPAKGDKDRDTAVAEYHSMVNRIRFIKKWYPANLAIVTLGVIFALIKRVLKGKWRLAKNASIAILKIYFTRSSTV